MGMTGYIPTYLKNLGWGEASADIVLAAFYAVTSSAWCGFHPVDKLGRRKPIMFVAIVISAIAVALVPFAMGPGLGAGHAGGFLIGRLYGPLYHHPAGDRGGGPAAFGHGHGVVFTVAQVAAPFPRLSATSCLDRAAGRLFLGGYGSDRLGSLFMTRKRQAPRPGSLPGGCFVRGHSPQCPSVQKAR
jgi:hypothetical protein